MIVDYLNGVRLTTLPFEYDPPLIVDIAPGRANQQIAARKYSFQVTQIGFRPIGRSAPVAPRLDPTKKPLCVGCAG